MGKKSQSVREDLEVNLLWLPALKGHFPAKGWIRAIREALGMSGRHLADRMAVQQPRIPELERNEIRGNITLKSLRRAAEAMDCELVYAIVPKTSLEDSVRKQAEREARRRMDSVDQTMRLEDQGLLDSENRKQEKRLVEEWTQNPPRWLWDQP